jgi:hypothetical protein
MTSSSTSTFTSSSVVDNFKRENPDILPSHIDEIVILGRKTWPTEEFIPILLNYLKEYGARTSFEELFYRLQNIHELVISFGADSVLGTTETLRHLLNPNLYEVAETFTSLRIVLFQFHADKSSLDQEFVNFIVDRAPIYAAPNLSHCLNKFASSSIKANMQTLFEYGTEIKTENRFEIAMELITVSENVKKGTVTPTEIKDHMSKAKTIHDLAPLL